MRAYPGQVRSSTPGPGVTYVRRSDHYAVRRPKGRAVPSGAVMVLKDDEGGTVAVYRGSPAPRATNDEALPVYSVGEDGPLAVPTGRVFVRLPEGVTAEERRAEFAAAGFEITRTVPYAPNAAWLGARQGGVAGALAGLAVLVAMTGAVTGEPQMLMARVSKDRSPR